MISQQANPACQNGPVVGEQWEIATRHSYYQLYQSSGTFVLTSTGVVNQTIGNDGVLNQLEQSVRIHS
jgi:hypothetical protein